MGTVTVALDDMAYSPIDSNAGWQVRAVITMSTTYATGGDTVSATAFGLGSIRKMDVAAGGAVGGTQAYLFEPVQSSGTVAKIQAFWTGASTAAVFAEVGAGTDLSAAKVSVIVWGD